MIELHFPAMFEEMNPVETKQYLEFDEKILLDAVSQHDYIKGWGRLKR
jgi:hypothetical protein